jgi:hypothetical protein
MHTAQSTLDLYGVSAIEIVLIVIPIKHFEVQDMRPIKGQYHLNATAMWGLIPGELNRNVLKLLRTK